MYDKIEILTLDGGVRYHKNVIYPEISFNENDVYIISCQGDRFDLLANKFYGDYSLWWVISAANYFLPQNSIFIPTGTQIRIPQNLQNILYEFQKLNE